MNDWPVEHTKQYGIFHHHEDITMAKEDIIESIRHPKALKR
jgi:hypothetical protein